MAFRNEERVYRDIKTKNGQCSFKFQTQKEEEYELKGTHIVK